MAKKLLVLSIASLVIGLAFVTGIINVQNTVDLYVALPLGAVFLGLFLMFRTFEKEVSGYDAEQQSHPAFQMETVRVTEKSSDCSTHAHGKSATTH